MTDLRVITTDGAEAVHEESAAQDFADSLRGRLLRPADNPDFARLVVTVML
jgi:hypothetical protein